MKVVFDTNILISAIVYGGTPRYCLDIAREGKIKFYTSRILLLELATKLQKKFEWEDYKIETTIRGISKYARIVEPSESIDVISKDEKDNRILEVASEVDADFIVSGDKKHILPLEKFGNTIILSAAEFIKLIDTKD
ncbi:putative toxin-antitoxin system toxin component, PIN family [Candidatus Woesebacteria bacterium RIFCSPLOWO2_01_FULL_39_61]|uniref:Putative toxin-antitoxin system toxin component, PIN family n=1 Tax=Candidatus Woesebacteria bacterium RIFCSPHIGHO2_02_FULL_39_13 TaxID=1802505 RepID=A0A1F7Z5K8_9BACT|nr:MAG: putative toxin-antitoxin system toxin component, PIN family [Candidatus Woesebacteria bacterium RIFCSPHIGHO2_01_FULL_39_95]OGM34419.1 MAG: putative toxin-antitoxin system toxin component, PIN family [Candidatus Woesebacteria bacterium RIFCSPHIGHO2_02_FULL_39_13]OGM36236.1 MAG: putative toxin-antitoxin system toxin component, PIN family [Candidatus Woesebacteria bacterium RIFCSPHIGHO2_12_FULL_40_20]OGM68284.1 MAG: putative toxin-antitoxin system toxin component, PIN family [Candidatus Woe